MNIIIKDEIKAFFKGFASTFDISGNSLLSIPDFSTGFQRDTEAFRGDWYRIGNDFRKAMNIVVYEQK